MRQAEILRTLNRSDELNKHLTNRQAWACLLVKYCVTDKNNCGGAIIVVYKWRTYNVMRAWSASRMFNYPVYPLSPK